MIRIKSSLKIESLCIKNFAVSFCLYYNSLQYVAWFPRCAKQQGFIVSNWRVGMIIVTIVSKSMQSYRRQVYQAKSIILFIKNWGLGQKHSVLKWTSDSFVCRVCNKAKFWYRFEEWIEILKNNVTESLLFNFTFQVL